MTIKSRLCAAALGISASATAQAQTAAPAIAPEPAVRVTPDNFARAESDMYFASVVADAGIGKLRHHRELMPIGKQSVVRANRDTLYSSAVIDLDAGPVTVTLPDAGSRFLSMQLIDEEDYTPAVFYGAGSHTITRRQVGTRYVLIGIRILVDPTNPQDAARVHALQDAIVLNQPGGAGRFTIPNWDTVSRKQVRDALIALYANLPDARRAFGARGAVDPVRHLIGTATQWGGNPDKDALYLNFATARNDGVTIYRLTVRDVPVDAFWSVSVYNARGYFDPSQTNYTLNNLTAKKGADGSVTIQFGGCDGGAPNCLSTVPGWNYLVRLYRPREALLKATWSFPDAREVR